MATTHRTGKDELQSIAHEAMLQRGLLPDFSPAVIAQTNQITQAATASDAAIRDLRGLLWASIDNDDSRDLDQLSVAEPVAGGTLKILVAIADVDALVEKDSAIDGHACTNTTSVYTAAEIFPMLPERLSTDLTSLSEDQERLAIVVEMVIATDGTVTASDIYRAVVLNRAKLAYNAVAAWLEGAAPAPPKLAAVPGLDEQLRIQDRAAQALKRLRHAHGALRLETLEVRAVFDDGALADLLPDDEEPGKGTDRRLHDCGQWRIRKISRKEGLALAAPGAAYPQALGPDRRAGGRVGEAVAADTGRCAVWMLS